MFFTIEEASGQASGDATVEHNALNVSSKISCSENRRLDGVLVEGKKLLFMVFAFS